MTKSVLRLSLSALLLFFQIAAYAVDASNSSMTLYGSEFPKEGEIVTLKTAISKVSDSGDKNQKISGLVTKACQKKGCWMILTDGDVQARITFKDYGFFVPPNTSQAKALVYGKLTETTLSEKRAKHYAKDEGKSGENIKGPVKEYSIVASGVYLEK